MNLLALLGAALGPSITLAPMPVEPELSITNTNVNIKIYFTLEGIEINPVYYLTTNWIIDPVDNELETGLIYSNITVRLVYENKTNQVTLASKLVGLAGSRKAERPVCVNGWMIGPTNWITTNQYLLHVH